jgi:hypothetical protein
MCSYGVVWTFRAREVLHDGDSSGAPPKCLLGRGRRGPVKGVSPGGGGPSHHARLPEARGRGLNMREARPGGVLWTLDGVPPPTTLVLGGAPEGRGGGLWVL